MILSFSLCKFSKNRASYLSGKKFLIIGNLFISHSVSNSKKMKFRLLIPLILIAYTPLFSQLDRYGAVPLFKDKGVVYEYKKSNWDGSHPSTIYLYVADSEKLESFKWYEGDDEATLVTAIIDWKNYSVKNFINHKLRKGKTPELIAQLKMESDKKIRIDVGPMHDSLMIDELPWQSYDFDFAGLGLTWRALKDKKQSFWFHIADAGMINGNMAFITKGRVDVKFTGYEKVNEKECLKYSANGPGLENKGGHIWIDPDNFMIEQYRIELPDEQGFENGMLLLVKKHKMSSNEWEMFMKKCLGE